MQELSIKIAEPTTSLGTVRKRPVFDFTFKIKVTD